MTLTPTVLADYMYYDAQNYTESGAGGANLHVNQSSYNELNLGAGLKAGWAFKNDDGSWIKPSLHASYRYNVLNDDIKANTAFAAGGPTFTTNGLNPGRSTFNAGADLKFLATTNWEFSAGYDFTAKSQYTAHSGILRAGYKF